MRITEIGNDERYAFLDLLLLGDEQPEMVEKYIDKGRMIVLYDDACARPAGEAVVIKLHDGAFEIKNIAVDPCFQKRGYGSALIRHIQDLCSREGDCVLFAGTGDSPSTLGFYRKCGFEYSHTVKDFFTENYDHPIYEDGVLLADMIYLKKRVPASWRRKAECSACPAAKTGLLKPQNNTCIKPLLHIVLPEHGATMDAEQG